MLSTAPNERALLGCLLTKLAALDADVLVGHNIGAYELVVLLTRLQTHKVSVIAVVAAMAVAQSPAWDCRMYAHRRESGGRQAQCVSCLQSFVMPRSKAHVE